LKAAQPRLQATPLTPAGKRGEVKLLYKIELVEKQKRRVAVVSSGQWFWAKSVLGLPRRAPEAPVRRRN